MALTDFFRINFPYGIKRNSKGQWVAFNREYMPLGWNSKEGQETIHGEEPYDKLPIYTKYKSVTEAKLIKLAGNDENRVSRDNAGKIHTVWLYGDSTNPKSNPKHWNDYFEKVKLLSSFVISV